ncbi:MAG TPA: glycosyltransferase family 1 protein [Mycobacteriales bacterium]|nr:glycosyltransferase family 1 protein [Mycobacteriales bacterium]
MGDAGPRVLVDATAVPEDRGGVGRYVDGLVQGLDALHADLVIACQPRDAEHLAALAPGATVVPAPDRLSARPARLAWEQTGLPALVRRTGAQVLHSPHYTLPLRAGVPTVVTLHDATFFTDPALHSGVKSRFFRTATRTALRRASRCVVPSVATREELVRVAGADPARIVVAPHGVDRQVFAPPDAEARQRVRELLGLAGQAYVAFVGTHEPRKNLPVLVRAWVAACRERVDPPALVLAGGAGWDAELEDAAALVPEGLRLIRPGYLPLVDLAGLLGGALVVAYPSLGEGFGLPVLEAMACGAPVLTTRRLALPEVGGDAVAYAEPDAGSLTAALTGLLDDAPRRAELARAGLTRVASFTWEASAEAHLKAYAHGLAG